MLRRGIKEKRKRKEEEKQEKQEKNRITGLEDQQWRQDSVINPVNWL